MAIASFAYLGKSTDAHGQSLMAVGGQFLSQGKRWLTAAKIQASSEFQRAIVGLTCIKVSFPTPE